MYAPKQSPCKDCTDRVLGCHGKCEKYQAYHKANVKRCKGMSETARVLCDNEIHRRKVRNYYEYYRRKR